MTDANERENGNVSEAERAMDDAPATDFRVLRPLRTGGRFRRNHLVPTDRRGAGSGDEDQEGRSGSRGRRPGEEDNQGAGK